MNRQVKIESVSIREFKTLLLAIMIMEVQPVKECSQNSLANRIEVVKLLSMINAKELIFPIDYHVKEEDLQEYPLILEMVSEEYDNKVYKTLIIAHYNGLDYHHMNIKYEIILENKEHEA